MMDVINVKFNVNMVVMFVIKISVKNVYMGMN